VKKLLYGCLAVALLAGFIVYGFLSAPKVIRLEREYTTTAYTIEDTDFGKPVNVSLQGVFDEKSQSYLGKLNINGKEYTDCRLSPEWAMMKCTVDGGWGVLLGQVYADKYFKEWCLALAPSYDSNRTENDLYKLLSDDALTENKIIVAIPALDREAALAQYDRLWRAWGDDWESRN
jgi:hypothetical protein